MQYQVCESQVEIVQVYIMMDASLKLHALKAARHVRLSSQDWLFTEEKVTFDIEVSWS